MGLLSRLLPAVIIVLVLWLAYDLLRMSRHWWKENGGGASKYLAWLWVEQRESLVTLLLSVLILGLGLLWHWLTGS